MSTPPDLDEIYDAYAASEAKQRAWSGTNPGNQAIRAELADAIMTVAADALDADGAVLDCGCGTGWWLEHLARTGIAGGRLHGVDALQRRVAATQARVPDAAVQAGDIGTLPWPDGHFELVTLLSVLSSLSSVGEQRRALDEALRVTAAGGVVVVWDLRRDNPRNPHTRAVGAALSGREAVAERAITVLPALARRLGRATPYAYPLLATVPVLRTHRLVVLRPHAAASSPSPS